MPRSIPRDRAALRQARRAATDAYQSGLRGEAATVPTGKRGRERLAEAQTGYGEVPLGPETPWWFG